MFRYNHVQPWGRGWVRNCKSNMETGTLENRTRTYCPYNRDNLFETATERKIHEEIGKNKNSWGNFQRNKKIAERKINRKQGMSKFMSKIAKKHRSFCLFLQVINLQCWRAILISLADKNTRKKLSLPPLLDVWYLYSSVHTVFFFVFF